MAEPPVSSELLAALQTQLSAIQSGGWGMIPAMPTIQGISVPIRMETPQGAVRVYLHLPAECAASSQTLISTLQAIAQKYPLDAWQGKGKKSW